ncbi:MAG TPA: hypothetical protein VI408_05330 [Gaiellaceae bacterium]
MPRLVVVAAVVAAALWTVAPASADDWLPHNADATWTYSWSDSVYSPTPVTENVTVKSQSGATFVLAWTQGDPAKPTAQGTVSFQDTDSGLNNTDWSSTPPPPNMPILCAQASGCGNSLASTYYDIIWGSRAPVVAEPLTTARTWTGVGGAANDVSGTSTYIGQQSITVPAFTDPVVAAVVKTRVTQAGALGDPYGSGTRTVWWVYGVGPVKVEFDHAGGTGAPVTTSVLQSTSLKPEAVPSDLDWFPLTQGLTQRYKWTNTKHLKQPEIEQVAIQAAQNSTARFTVTSVSGPIRTSASYGYTSRVSGVTNLWSAARATTLAKFPPLGPKSAKPSERRHFFTPFDLMNFGFNPILPAYAKQGDTWSAAPSGTDFDAYGVVGTSTVLGVQKVTVPGGTFNALAVRTKLKQPGFPFGSGTRTCWFAPGKGLVKLVFSHGDGSTSTVVLIKK